MEFEIRPDKAALLIVDMQNAFLRPGSPLERPKGRDIVPGLNKLIHACRDAEISIIFFRHAFRKDGSDIGLFAKFYPIGKDKFALIEGKPDADIYNEVERRNDDVVITKQAYSGFVGTGLDFLLRLKGIDTVIIGGVDTRICCEATARDARHRNYQVIFLNDGTATKDQPGAGWGAMSADEVQRFVLTTMAQEYAEVLAIEEVIKRIHGSSAI